MRTLAVLAAVCVCVAATETGKATITADKTFIARQKSIYQLLWHVDQPTTVHPELYQIARSYNINDHLDQYTNQTAVKHFQHILKHGMVPRGAIVSVFNEHHLEQAKALFDVFYTAKDFTTFYNTAVWARFNVNEALFVYCMIVSVLHRPDTKYMKLPPIYEMVPNNFFNNEVIQQAYRIKMGDVSGSKPHVTIKHLENGINDVTIRANYSGWYLTHGIHSEEQLSYFTEDIGLGTFYLYMKHEAPFWMNSQHYNLPKDIRGEVYYYSHKQLLARYYMERLSNGLGEIEYIDWHEPIVPGYHPTIFHRNGLPFPHRHSEAHIPVHKYKQVAEVEDIETHISGAVKSGYLIRDFKTKNVEIYEHPQGLNMLANAIEGNADSVNLRYYGSLDHVCKNILGFAHEPVHKNQIAPSALELFTTAPRDPAFYRIYKKILSYFVQYKENLPHYTEQELKFPGVQIQSVTVDKFTTFMDHFDSDIGNVLTVRNQKDAEDLKMTVRQHRLNHKPFTYHITINADKNVKAMVRIFLAPKFDEHGHELDIVDNWVNFLELDQFDVDLKSGVNKIERSDHESHYFIPDETSGRVRWQQLLKAETGEQYTYTKQVHGFPNRLALPKGKPEGMTFKLMVFVSPLETPVNMETPVWGPTVTDQHPMGYPMDRPLKYIDFTHLSNMYWKDVQIFHKHVEELNLTV